MVPITAFHFISANCEDEIGLGKKQKKLLLTLNAHYFFGTKNNKVGRRSVTDNIRVDSILLVLPITNWK